MHSFGDISLPDQVSELYTSNSSTDILQVVQGSRSLMYGCLHSVCLLLSPALPRKALDGGLITIMWGCSLSASLLTIHKLVPNLVDKS